LPSLFDGFEHVPTLQFLLCGREVVVSEAKYQQVGNPDKDPVGPDEVVVGVE
jgi:hypothetical protein